MAIQWLSTTNVSGGLFADMISEIEGLSHITSDRLRYTIDNDAEGLRKNVREGDLIQRHSGAYGTIYQYTWLGMTWWVYEYMHNKDVNVLVSDIGSIQGLFELI